MPISYPLALKIKHIIDFQYEDLTSFNLATLIQPLNFQLKKTFLFMLIYDRVKYETTLMLSYIVCHKSDDKFQDS